MGLLRSVKKRQIKHFTKMICRNMIEDFNDAKKNNSDSQNYQDWLIEAVSKLPDWTKIDNSIFQQNRSGATVMIKAGENLRDVVRNVVFAYHNDVIDIDRSPEEIKEVVINELSSCFEQKEINL